MSTSSFVAALLLFAVPVVAQPVDPGFLPPDSLQGRHATLFGWRHDVDVMLRDRRHAYGGLFFDRGLFRRLTPSMDHEYDLDVLTYGYSPEEDYAWYRSAHAFRTYMGSIHKSRFATQSEFRHAVVLRSRHTVTLDGIMQEDLKARRFFLEVGYAFQIAGRHRVGFTQTVGEYKPDLDFRVFYVYRDARLGTARLEATLLDFANDLIFDRLGVDPVLEDTTRSYAANPRLFALSWITRSFHGIRGELYAGVLPQSRALVRSQNDPVRRFTWKEAARYVGTLLEARRGPATAGVTFRYAYSRIGRRAPSGSIYTSDYTSRQSTGTVTGYLLGAWRQYQGDAWLFYEHYSDVQQGTDYDQAAIPSDLDYREHRLTLHLRLQRVPPRGFRIGLDYYLDHRSFYGDGDRIDHYLRFMPWTPNGRWAINLGYQFRPGVYVVAGTAYDGGGDPFYHDGRGLTRYDGGFGRVVVTW